MAIVDALSQLSEIPGISGHEGPVREAILDRIAAKASEAWVDSMGNLIILKSSGKSKAKRLMACAHMDEIGLMVAKVENNGLLRFKPVGGIDPRVLVAQEVRIGKDNLPGVIGMKPVHLTKPEERAKVPSHSDLAIDIGAATKEDALKRVQIGDVAHFATRFEKVGTLVKGKAFDDRLGCAILMGILDFDLPFDLYAAFTVQEEVGLRGARTAAFRIDPAACVTLEGTVADDLPDKKDRGRTTRVTGGPVLTVRDQSVVCDRRLVSHLMRTAEREGVPFQVKQRPVGGTDAGRAHLSREGVPSCVVSVPCRYIHSPASLASPEDVENAFNLVSASLPGMLEALG